MAETTRKIEALKELNGRVVRMTLTAPVRQGNGRYQAQTFHLEGELAVVGNGFTCDGITSMLADHPQVLRRLPDDYHTHSSPLRTAPRPPLQA
jgi:hypothetical protein